MTKAACYWWQLTVAVLAVTFSKFYVSSAVAQSDAMQAVANNDNFLSQALIQNRLQNYIHAKEGRPPKGQQMKRVPPKAQSAQQLSMAAAGAGLQTSSFCGDGICDAGENCSSCAQDCKQANGKPCKRVGIMYSLWHMPAWQAQQRIRNKGAFPRTVDKVLRSRLETPTGAVPGALNMSSILDVFGSTITRRSMTFHVHHTPRGGLYCIWKPRQPGALNYNPSFEGSYLDFRDNPECPNYVETLTRHAKQLTDAGVDYVVADMTNIYDYSAAGDAIQTRPFEVLLEVWSALRAQGIKTPDVAAWQRLPPPPATFEKTDRATMAYPMIVNLYNAPQFQQIIMKDSITRKKLFFLPQAEVLNKEFSRDIENNGGRNDIATVYTWVELEGNSTAPSTGWNFMSFCKNIKGKVNISDTPLCKPRPSGNIRSAFSTGTYGTQLAVSPSYQIGYASATYMATGQWEGVTFQQQLQAMLAAQPDYVFVSTWNEFIAQPYEVMLPPFVSQGFESDWTAGKLGYVDMLGGSFSRDIEPTVEGGSRLYDILRSCIQLFRQGVTTCADLPLTAATTLCCDSSFSARFTHVTTPEFKTSGQFTVRALAAGPAPDRTLLYSCAGSPIKVNKQPKRKLSPQLTAYVTHPTHQPPPHQPPATPQPHPTEPNTTTTDTSTTHKPAGNGGSEYGGPARGSEYGEAGDGEGGGGEYSEVGDGGAGDGGAGGAEDVGVGKPSATTAAAMFLSVDSKCEAGNSNNLSATPLGYIPIVKGGDFLRALRRCISTDGSRTRTYSLNSAVCPPGSDIEVVLGYVR